MHNDLPKVAVIISNYNYGKYVLDAIDSALAQDYKGDLRVYVVDDGSSDNSWEKLIHLTQERGAENVAEPYYSGPVEFRQADSLYVYRINNSGASTARNLAIWMAWDWADAFAILDADDLYYPNKVSVLTDKILSYPQIGVTYADYDIHRTYNNSNYTKREYKYPYCKRELQRQCIVHSGALIKKGALLATLLPEKNEFYDSRLHGPGSKEFIGCTEDYDLWLRLSEVCMMAHIPQSLSLVRETGQNQSLKMTQNIFNQNMEAILNR